MPIPTPLPVFYTHATFRPEQSLGYLMRRVISSLRAQVNAQLVEHELTFVQWLPLHKISVNDQHTVASLARELEVDPGAMTRVLDRLAAKGWLQRERSTQDRRVTRLILTPEGQQVAARVPPVLADVLNEHLCDFSHAEWQLLQQFLQRMLRNGEACAAQRALAHPAANTAVPTTDDQAPPCGL
jgi:DNA-binding MarR family transcriptional regulator